MVTTSGVRIRRRRDGGASLVEFALLAPVLFSLLLGMVTGGMALSYKNSMTNAIREGARLGATLPKHEDDAWAHWATDVQDRVLQLASGDLDADEVCVELVNVTSAGDSTVTESTPACVLSMTPPATPSSAPVGSCVVKVWGQRGADLNAVFFSRELTLVGRAVGVYERPECP